MEFPPGCITLVKTHQVKIRLLTDEAVHGAPMFVFPAVNSVAVGERVVDIDLV